MPAHTVAQLEAILGTGEYSYFAPGGSFLGAFRQVYPRLVDMGLWRDMAYEVSLSGQYGYVSLPEDTDAVLACTINGFPRNTRSLWHDVRITGRQTTLSGYYGIVDDGFHVMKTDLKDAQGVASEDDIALPLGDVFWAYRSGTGNVANTGDFEEAQISLTVKDEFGTEIALELGTSSALGFENNENPTRSFSSIVYSNVPYAVDIKDANFPSVVLATIPAGSGVVRVRRFRTSSKAPDTTVHLLVKRGAPSDITADTIIHLGNIGAIKHGLLGLIAEDNADLERANFHWGMAGKLLDQELAAMFGSAKPNAKFADPAISSGVMNFY